MYKLNTSIDEICDWFAENNFLMCNLRNDVVYITSYTLKHCPPLINFIDNPDELLCINIVTSIGYHIPLLKCIKPENQTYNICYAAVSHVGINIIYVNVNNLIIKYGITSGREMIDNLCEIALNNTNYPAQQSDIDYIQLELKKIDDIDKIYL